MRRIYTEFAQSVDTLVQNSFDDELIEQSLLSLTGLWARSQFSRNLVVIDTVAL